MKYTQIIIPILFASTHVGSSAVLSTIATSGYNQDVVYEAGLAGSATNGISANFGDRAFFESGAYSTGTPNYGITRLGNEMETAAGNSVQFDFQPFNTNNSLSVTTGGRTLSLVTPGSYQTLGFVAAGFAAASANSIISYTINYSTGAAVTDDFTIANWGNRNVIIAGLDSEKFIVAGGRAELTGGGGAPFFGQPNGKSFDQTLNAGNTWNFYLHEVNVDSSRIINSITFTGDKASIFGVTGAIPEPSTAGLAGLAGLIGILRRRR